MVEQLRACEHSAGVCQQVVEELVFGRRELDGVAGTRDPVCLGVEFQIGAAQHGLLRCSTCLLQTELHSGHQFGNGEWLDHVVVAAGCESAYSVVGRVPCREEDDRGTRAAVSKALQDLEPVELRHHHVEHDEIGSSVSRQFQAGATIVGPHRVHTSELEGGLDEKPDVLLVVHHEDQRGSIAHRTPST